MWGTAILPKLRYGIRPSSQQLDLHQLEDSVDSRLTSLHNSSLSEKYWAHEPFAISRHTEIFYRLLDRCNSNSCVTPDVSQYHVEGRI